jgi:hypothetical protein
MKQTDINALNRMRKPLVDMAGKEEERCLHSLRTQGQEGSITPFDKRD